MIETAGLLWAIFIMLFLVTNIVVLAFAVLGSWWLSGYDAKVTGENERNDFIRRAVRCGLSLFLSEMAFLNLWRYWRYDDISSGFGYLMFSLPLALLWCGCLSELASHVFHGLVDPQDDRRFDPNKTRRDLDILHNLIRSGRKEEAIQFCQMLKESGDVSIATLETVLDHLGVQSGPIEKPKPLAEAVRLRSERKVSDSEAILRSLLLENPANVEAALLLMRIYTQDMHRADKAGEVLHAIEQQEHVSRAYIEYARRSIHDWSHSEEKKEPVEHRPESIDELLAARYFGTAIEILERKTMEQPSDFDSWLKLAETYGRHCGNISRAEKVIQKIEANPAFSAEQIQTALTKLNEWREAGLQHH